MPTIAAFMQLLPEGFNGAPYRPTDATIYSVVEGRGESRVGNEHVRLGTARYLRDPVVGAGLAPGE